MPPLSSLRFKLRRPFNRTFKIFSTVIIACGLITAGWSPTVSAQNWYVYDQGEQLFLPEGPIDEDGILLIPLRSIAERFGYRIMPNPSGGVTLQGGAAGRIDIQAGRNKAIFNETVERELTIPPRVINDTMFIPLELAGEITDIGYKMDETAHTIQLRPAPAGSTQSPDSDYWYAMPTETGTSFIDRSGAEKLKLPYSTMDFGREARFPVRPFGEAGLMDRNGNLLKLSDNYYAIEAFSEGVAVFKKLLPAERNAYLAKQGAMDRNGRVIIPAVYDKLYPFNNGLAKAIRNGKSIYIDHSGHTVIPAIPGLLHSDSFSEGLAAVSISVKVSGKRMERYGFIDRTGRFVIQPQFDFAGAFHEGLAVVYRNGKSGAIDKNGRWVVQPTFLPGFLHRFNGGYADATIQQGTLQRQALVDRTGKVIHFNNIEVAGAYGEGLVAYRQGNLYGFADLTGKPVIKAQYVSVEPFARGAARVLLSNTGGVYKYGLIDRGGRLLWPQS